MTGRDADDRRTPEAAALREAVRELEQCLHDIKPEPGGNTDGVRPRLRSCAVTAHRLGLPPERFIIVLKRLLDRRPELFAEPETQLTAPKWSRREMIIAWAIEAYFEGRA